MEGTLGCAVCSREQRLREAPREVLDGSWYWLFCTAELLFECGVCLCLKIAIKNPASYVNCALLNLLWLGRAFVLLLLLQFRSLDTWSNGEAQEVGQNILCAFHEACVRPSSAMHCSLW